MLKYGVNTDPHFSLIITFAVHDLFQSVTMPWVYVFMTFVTANVTTFVKCSADPCCSPSVRIIFSYSNYTEFFLCFLLAPIHISSQGLALWWVWVCMHDWDEWRNKVPVNIGQSTKYRWVSWESSCAYLTLCSALLSLGESRLTVLTPHCDLSTFDFKILR